MGVKLLSPTPADLPLTVSPTSSLSLLQAPVFNLTMSRKPWGHGQPDPTRRVLNATAVLQPVLSPKQQWRRGDVLRADEAHCCAWVHTSSIVRSQSLTRPLRIAPTVQFSLPFQAHHYLLCPIHQPPRSQDLKIPRFNYTLY